MPKYIYISTKKIKNFECYTLVFGIRDRENFVFFSIKYFFVFLSLSTFQVHMFFFNLIFLIRNNIKRLKS